MSFADVDKQLKYLSQTGLPSFLPKISCIRLFVWTRVSFKVAHSQNDQINNCFFHGILIIHNKSSNYSPLDPHRLQVGSLPTHALLSADDQLLDRRESKLFLNVYSTGGAVCQFEAGYIVSLMA